MTIVYFTRHRIRYAQVWFNESRELASLSLDACDIIEFKESYTPLVSLYSFVNGAINLSEGTEKAFEKFDKGFKYELRRAEKENVICETATITSGQLEEIFRRYAAFSKTKDSPVLPFDFFELYQKCGSLLVTTARQANQLLQYHVYFSDPQEDLLLASFPADETAKKALVGFANRALHWYDIRRAHTAGRMWYNLGGMGNSGAEETMGIARFKREMAPEEIPYFQGSLAVTLKGRLYSRLRHLIKS